MSIIQYFDQTSAPIPLDWSPSWLDFAKKYGLTVYDVSNRESVLTALTGGVPANAGDPVGMVLDLTGVIEGVEQFLNPDFKEWVNGTPVGWTIAATTAENYIEQNPLGARLVWVTGGGLTRAYQNVPTTGPRWVEIDVIVNAGAILLSNGSGGDIAGVNTIISKTGTYRFFLTDSTIGFKRTGNLGDVDVIITRFSVKTGTGTHAIAPSNAARPTLTRMPATGRRNILEFTEDLSNLYWQTFSGAVKEQGDRLVSTGQSRPRTQSGVRTGVVPVGTSVNFSVDVYPDALLEEVYFQMRQNNEAGIGGLPSAQRFTFASLVDTVGVSEKLNGNGWRLFIKGTTTVEVTTIRFGLGLGDATNAVPNGIGAKVTKFQATFTLNATPYQKVTNAFDVTEAGVPDTWSLTFDGFDDVMIATTSATIKLPIYTGAAVERNNYPDVAPIFAIRRDATNYAGLLSSGSAAGTRIIGGLRSTLRGPSSIQSVNNSSPLNVPDHFDTLSVVGTTDIRIKNSNPVTTPNAWPSGDQVAGAAINLFTPTLAGRFYRGVIINKAMSEVERGLINQWLKKGYTQ